jgi:hypothetical protein
MLKVLILRMLHIHRKSESGGYWDRSGSTVPDPGVLQMWIRCTISRTLISLLAAINRLQTRQWDCITPGLVLSNRRTNGSSDHSGIQDYLPWFKHERKANQEDGLAASHPCPMLQTFLITSIKNRLKTLITTIGSNSRQSDKARSPVFSPTVSGLSEMPHGNEKNVAQGTTQ